MRGGEELRMLRRTCVYLISHIYQQAGKIAKNVNSGGCLWWLFDVGPGAEGLQAFGAHSPDGNEVLGTALGMNELSERGKARQIERDRGERSGGGNDDRYKRKRERQREGGREGCWASVLSVDHSPAGYWKYFRDVVHRVIQGLGSFLRCNIIDYQIALATNPRPVKQDE